MIGAEGHVSHQKGVLHGAAHGAGVMQHLVHGDRQGAVIAEHDLGERVSDEDEVHAGFIGQARGGVIVGGERDDGLVLALLLRQGVDGDALAEIAGSDAHGLLQCGSAEADAACAPKRRCGDTGTVESEWQPTAVADAGLRESANGASGLIVAAGERRPEAYLGRRIPAASYSLRVVLLAERKEILRALDGLADPAQQDLEVFAALDEVDLGGVDDQQIAGGVVEEEMFVGLDDLFHVLVADGALVGDIFAAQALAQDIERRLEVDDQVRGGQFGAEEFVVAVVNGQLVVGEVEVGEELVFLEDVVGDDDLLRAAGGGKGRSCS